MSLSRGWKLVSCAEVLDIDLISARASAPSEGSSKPRFLAMTAKRGCRMSLSEQRRTEGHLLGLLAAVGRADADALEETLEADALAVG